MSDEEISAAEKTPLQELGRGRTGRTPLGVFLAAHLIVLVVAALIMVTILIVVLLL